MEKEKLFTDWCKANTFWMTEEDFKKKHNLSFIEVRKKYWQNGLQSFWIQQSGSLGIGPLRKP